MDGEKDCQRKKEARDDAPSPGAVPFASGEETDWEGMLNTERQRGDLGDMTFCMANYLKETMKMMFMMRSHHMLTDVILEVGTELFHAHKVILAAASPYFKVSLTAMQIKYFAFSDTSQYKCRSIFVSEYQERMIFVLTCVIKCKVPSVACVTLEILLVA